VLLPEIIIFIVEIDIMEHGNDEYKRNQILQEKIKKCTHR
jgi:hypothetical protein